MASPFQRYTSGIEASTGNLVPAYARMAEQTANALAGLGQSIGQGIQLYAENQRKSEAADATIASGIARFKSLADVYGKDPEFAPVVAQFAERLKQYENAPSMSYAKKAVAANEINMLGQELGQTLQAYQVIRGREVERVGGEILSQFPNVEKVTDPTFIKEGTNKFKTDRDFISNEGEFLAGLNKFRQAAKEAGKEIKGTDAEALDAYRRNVQDSVNQAMSAGTLDKAIGSRIIEQVEAARKLGTVKSGVIAGGATMGDMEAVALAAYQPPVQAKPAAEKPSDAAKGATAPESAPKKSGEVSEEMKGLMKAYLFAKPEEREGIQRKMDVLNAKDAGKTRRLTADEKNILQNEVKNLEGEIRQKFGIFSDRKLSPARAKERDEIQGRIKSINDVLSTSGKYDDESAATEITRNNTLRTKIQTYADQSEVTYLKELLDKVNSGDYISSSDRMKQHYFGAIKRLNVETKRSIARDPAFKGVSDKLIDQELDAVDKRRSELDDFVLKLRNLQDLGLGEGGRDILPEKKRAIVEALEARIASLSKPRQEPEKVTPEKVREMTKGIVGQTLTPAVPQKKEPAVQAPVVSLGRQAVGSVEYERKVSLADKKAKVAELLTQRIGVTDPATGKKTLPAGFDSWFKQMVPESDARVVDVDGVKLLWNGKGFEQVKMEQAKMPTAKEIGENNAFIFGVQTDKGLQPTELVPESGILIGGIVSGSTAGAEKVREQLTDLIDLRSSVSRLTAINDKVGESLSLRDQGISQYDLMKLRAVLTKQVNVSGSISDYERKAIEKMTPDPTAFLDFEPKTRAALLGIALGIDRDIKTLATSRGLTVIMQENGGKTQNQSLRQKYLSEKSK